VEKQKLYEELYCARGDMENRIKEQFVLFADRGSVSTLRGNQLRVYLSVLAYTLMNGLRRLGLQATTMATAQVGTIRLKLLKIGALIKSPFASVGPDGQQLSLPGVVLSSSPTTPNLKVAARAGPPIFDNWFRFRSPACKDWCVSARRILPMQVLAVRIACQRGSVEDRSGL